MKKSKEPQTREDAFIMEVNEELKNERVQKMWEKYGLYIILFVVVVLTATVSFETIKSWRARKYQELSDQYAVAVAVQNQGRYEDSIALLDNLQTKAKKGIYADLAQIQKANIMFEQNKGDQAAAILEEFISKKSANQQLNDVAVIKLASYKLDNGSKEEIETLLNPLAVDGGNWTSIAKEMLAMLAIRENDMEKAKDLYEQIASNPSTPDTLKARAQDILILLNDTNK